MPCKVIKQTSYDFDLSTRETERLIDNAPSRYKIFDIYKRNKKDTRTIAQPAKEIKILQNWAIQKFLNDLRPHHTATAYEKKKSIKSNAYRHKNSRYLLKMDFADFFPSILQKDFKYWIRYYKPDEFSKRDLYYLSHLFFWFSTSKNKLVLSIGAPSSPKLSNIIMKNIDEQLFEFSKYHNVTYTRYADDLVFSTNEPYVLKKMEKKVYDILGNTRYPKLHINTSKTVFSSKKYSRFVTGLVLTNQHTISIGRRKKRLIRSMIHHFKYNNLSDDEISYLKGYLAFIADVEPTFLTKMKNYYGSTLINNIKTY